MSKIAETQVTELVATINNMKLNIDTMVSNINSRLELLQTKMNELVESEEALPMESDE